jgi:hypothetical protein
MTITSLPASAQKKPEGIYTFQRQELVASFNFMPDNTFEFFYSYGAVDRTASGTFSMSGDTVKLQSSKEPGKDFTVVHQSQKGRGCVVVVKGDNPVLIRNVLAIAVIDGEHKYFESDEEGIIKIADRCDKIFLQHTLYPDALTILKEQDNDNNYFEVTLNPVLGEISFLGIDFLFAGDELTCPSNYFLPLDNISFSK